MQAHERLPLAAASLASKIAPMRVGIPSEHGQVEHRVALTPDAIARLQPLGVEVLVQAGAGDAAALPDSDYTEAGARVVPDGKALLAESDLIVMVTRPREDEVSAFRSDTALVGMLQPLVHRELVDGLATAGVTAFSLDAIPRTTRAQIDGRALLAGDVAGYKAVLLAADAPAQVLPDADDRRRHRRAGRVLVLGAGVAGLQAIATARRLGAVVEAFDARPVVQGTGREPGREVRRDRRSARTREAAGGYAKELSEDAARRSSRSWSREHVGRARRRDHHRADPRPPRADAGHRGRW